MKTFFLKYLFVAIISICAIKSFAQTIPLYDSATLMSMPVVTSLQEAFQNPDAVIKLDLRKCKLKEFPKEIFQLKNLQYLDLSKNNIKEIPEEIAQLKNLQYLSLSKNKIENIPGEIGELSNLFYLNINQNNIIALPAQLGKLEKLVTLDLWSNDISFFPEELKYMKSLKVMDLRVILIADAEQARIQKLLPDTKIHFSPYCKCAQ